MFLLTPTRIRIALPFPHGGVADSGFEPRVPQMPWSPKSHEEIDAIPAQVGFRAIRSPSSEIRQITRVGNEYFSA
jgi:hypothetical protein